MSGTCSTHGKKAIRAYKTFVETTLTMTQKKQDVRLWTASKLLRIRISRGLL